MIGDVRFGSLGFSIVVMLKVIDVPLLTNENLSAGLNMRFLISTVALVCCLTHVQLAAQYLAVW
jgi:hypothetical protein